MNTPTDSGAVIVFSSILLVLLLCAVGLFLQRKKPAFTMAKTSIPTPQAPIGTGQSVDQNIPVKSSRSSLIGKIAQILLFVSLLATAFGVSFVLQVLFGALAYPSPHWGASTRLVYFVTFCCLGLILVGGPILNAYAIRWQMYVLSFFLSTLTLLSFPVAVIFFFITLI